jgi:hypothetical protein
MRLARHLTLIATLLLAAGPAAAQSREGDWVSYRDAYRAMVVFEKYGGAKNLIQNQLQVLPRDGGEPAQVLLTGKATQLNLPLDPLGRTVLPLLKAAYDENAALVLPNKGGQFQVRSRVSIALRADGIYEVGELRSACEQALGFARYADRSVGAKQCAGVRFVFPKRGEWPVHLRRAGGADAVLPAVEGAAFQGDADSAFPTVTYRFNGGGHAQVVAAKAPLAIVPVFE